MGIITDTKATLERCRGYGNHMKGLFSRHEVHNAEDLKRVARDTAFQSDVAAPWEGIPKAEGEKITLIILMTTIAIAMGSAGIAAGCGAIGLPLLATLAPAGFFAGQELDSEGYTPAVVDKFRTLLQYTQKLDAEQYTGMLADKFKELVDTIHELDSEGYAKKAVDSFKKFLHKAADASS